MYYNVFMNKDAFLVVKVQMLFQYYCNGNGIFYFKDMS